MNYDNDPEPRDRPLRIVELMAVIGRLRGALATVTAERDALRVLNKNNDMVHTRTFQAERNAHAETRKALDVSLANELMLKNACAARNAELELARENASDQEAELFDSINELEMQLESAHSAHAETRAALKRKLADIRTEWDLWTGHHKSSFDSMGAIGLILRGEP